MTEITIEVAAGNAQQQFCLRVQVPEGSTLQAAITQSCILQKWPQIDLQQWRVGVFGKLARLDESVKAGDRIEIYQPLKIDPKQARLARAKKGASLRA